MEDRIKNLLPYLPHHTSATISALLSKNAGDEKELTEIRLHADRPTSLTAAGKNVSSFSGKHDICTREEISKTLAKLTEDSVHTYGDMMREGFINLEGGYRVGVCGSASVSDGAIRSVYGLTTLCIRIPRAVRNVESGLLKVISGDGDIKSALIYSLPCVGKTTLIRALAAAMSSGEGARRVAVVDTRNEIYMSEMFRDSTADFLSGYPRAAGIEIATRTLSPEVVICDEIGGDAEARAILSAQNTGVPLIATAHGKSAAEVVRRPNIKVLCDAGVFRYLVGISRDAGGAFMLDVTDTAEGEK